jgi:hypothetical protein
MIYKNWNLTDPIAAVALLMGGILYILPHQPSGGKVEVMGFVGTSSPFNN